jgi:hypothetical protein
VRGKFSPYDPVQFFDFRMATRGAALVFRQCAEAEVDAISPAMGFMGRIGVMGRMLGAEPHGYSCLTKSSAVISDRGDHSLEAGSTPGCL